MTGEMLGIGTDLVECDRFRLALERRPRIAERLFSDAEREYAFRHIEPVPPLAARFAAKEAVMKAMSVGLWKFAMRDVEVIKLPSGQPEIVLHNKAAALADQRGVGSWLLTLSHVDSMAIAVAVALR
jgi:holo-[acyl-carrier protein] synthase